MKKVLLIGGGGTLGSYTAEELLRLGHSVDIVCLEDAVSDNENLTYHTGAATLDFLQELFAKKRYDGIVNFVHYSNHEDYKPIHALLTNNTDHLIFVSSYRVYADEQHPITEEAPHLLDVIKDDAKFIATENYALSKSKAERFLHDNPYPKNWTIVRPVISSSHRRLDIVMTSRNDVVVAAKEGRALDLPLQAKNLTAGLDWAGNSGKLIAHLLFKKECIGEAYTVSSGQNLKWSEVADIYTELLGVKFNWVHTDFPADCFGWYYDRGLDRCVDCSKILKATGLTPADFTSMKDGIAIELKKLGAI